jgi:hypothetical protein
LFATGIKPLIYIDRVGNLQELEQYFVLYELFNKHLTNHFLKIIVIEHDGVSLDVAPIRKGTDGRALK